jgi:hypothetical protein
VAALAVVEDLKMLENGIGKFDPGSPFPAVEQLDLHAAPERFDDRIVEAIAN